MSPRVGPWSALHRSPPLPGYYRRGEPGRTMAMAWTDGAWSATARVRGRWRWRAGREADVAAARRAADAWLMSVGVGDEATGA